MKKYQRLVIIAVVGIATMFLLTWGLYALRDVLQANGYAVSLNLFLMIFVVVVGGMFSIGTHLAMREIRRLDAEKGSE